MAKVLVLAPSPDARGGIVAVLKLYRQSEIWNKYHCHWIATYREGTRLRKVWYLLKGFAEYIVLLPFYDIVHIHFSLAVSARRKYHFFKLAKLFGKKTVIHLHCGSQIDDIWNSTYEAMFEQCDYGILLSESLKSKIEGHTGRSENLRVVYNPCPAIADTGGFKNKNQILFSGTLYDGKGYKDLLRAFAMISNKYPDWRVAFAGNGELEQARVLAMELGISSQIELLGWVSGEAKHRTFCESKALCLPSYAEGFPMAVLDAWAYGLPVVTTPVGGIPDVAQDGVNMLLFEPGDVEQLSKQLEKIITDDKLRQSLSRESMEMARGPFALDTVTGQVGVVYEELTKE